MLTRAAQTRQTGRVFETPELELKNVKFPLGRICAELVDAALGQGGRPRRIDHERSDRRRLRSLLIGRAVVF